ncbi:MAG: patatin-like phospholipase family protein [Candidatus Vogelbacteria bacterium]|nr:patatin-like phospholipase family protein [Candidatus Vogelbacteria bacterium]
MKDPVGNFLKKLKEEGYTIYVVGSVGAIPAIAAALALWQLLEPYKEYIDGIRTASGSGIPLALAASGVSGDKIRKLLLGLHLKDVVEDIGFFAEHNETKSFFDNFRNLRAYFLAGFRAASTILKHLVDHRIGIISGENIKLLLDQGLKTNDFAKTSPPLEVVATLIDGSQTYVFSKDTTPKVKISEAIVASCAIRHIFALQTVHGQQFVDAAQKESIPILSVIDSHIKKGLDPSKLLIIGTFVHTLSRKSPSVFHFLEMEKYFTDASHHDTFRSHLELAGYRGAKCMILELDATNIELPHPDQFPDFMEFGAGFRRIRKIIASLFNKGLLEKILRGVSIYLYKEINMQHLPYYLDPFEKSIKKKLQQKIDSFKI